LVAVLVVLIVSPAASSLRLVGGFLKGGCCVPRPLRTTEFSSRMRPVKLHYKTMNETKENSKMIHEKRVRNTRETNANKIVHPSKVHWVHGIES